MAKTARKRESLHTRAVYRYHPVFKDEKFDVLLDAEVVNHQRPSKVATCTSSDTAPS